jgi:hypothetical protein
MDISDVLAPSIPPTPGPSAARIVAAKQVTVSERAPSLDPGPPTRVSVSEAARAQLREAGMGAAEMAAINLQDAGAVTRAMREALKHRFPTALLVEPE